MRGLKLRFGPGLLGIFSLAAGLSSLAALEVPLEVRESQGYTRRSEVVTLGVPLPRGEVTDLQRLSVSGPGGAPVPAQFETTATWPDGSTKWVLVDFIADCAAKGTTVYTLRDNGLKPDSMPVLRILEHGDILSVETGVVRCDLNRKYFDLFSKVYLDHNRDGVFSEDELVSSVEGVPGIQAVDALGRRLCPEPGLAA